MQVGVRVEEEDMRSGARTHCVSAYLTFVSIAGRRNGERERVPPCLPSSIAASPPSTRHREVITTSAAGSGPSSGHPHGKCCKPAAMVAITAARGLLSKEGRTQRTPPFPRFKATAVSYRTPAAPQDRRALHWQ